MYKHIAEAFVAVAHAQRVTENICARVQDFCQSTVSVDPDRLLDFGDGRVIIRPVDEGLLVHVSAEHLVIFYGIRALLEGSLIKYLPRAEGAIEWLPADRAPFRAINRHVADGGAGKAKCP
ncbi:hypothetical protein LJR011_005112 [Agrobacterium tumefaciens]